MFEDDMTKDDPGIVLFVVSRCVVGGIGLLRAISSSNPSLFGILSLPFFDGSFFAI